MSEAIVTTRVKLELKERWSWSPALVLSRWLGITRGEVATLAVAVAVALVLTIGGLPPVLRQRGAASGEFTLSPPPLSPAPSPAVDTPSAAPNAPGAPVMLAPEPGVAFSDTTSVGSTGAVSPAPTPSERTTVSPPATGETAVFAPVPAAPYGLAVGGDGTVATSTDEAIYLFGPDGSSAGEIKVAGVSGLAFDREGALIALEAATGRVLRVNVANGAQTELGTLSDLPRCSFFVASAGCEPGFGNDKPLPRGLAFERAGTLYITDAAQGTIWRLEPGGKPEPWLAANQFANADGLAGIAVEPSGSLLVASPSALDVASPGGGGVYRIPVNGDGTAGTPELVIALGSSDKPVGLALLPDGSIVVSLERAVALFDAEGTEIRRVTGNNALSRPSGLAFLGNTLLAAITGAEGASEWAVLAVGVT